MLWSVGPSECGLVVGGAVRIMAAIGHGAVAPPARGADPACHSRTVGTV